MTSSLTLAVLFALHFATPPPPLLRLEVDAFRGARTGNDSESRSPLATRILTPWAAGWSDDTDLQRTRIRDVAGLEHATLVLSETMPFERRSGTIRGAGYWIGVRFPRVGTRDADLEIRIVRDRDVEAGLGAPSAASVRLCSTAPSSSRATAKTSEIRSSSPSHSRTIRGFLRSAIGGRGLSTRSRPCIPLWPRRAASAEKSSSRHSSTPTGP